MDAPTRVLIVEDESVTALGLARQLRRLGYAVVASASSGPQAIEHAPTRHPQVVLMDIQLHGTMDGIDAAPHIQASAPIPVVYMSAHADAATVEHFQATTQTAGLVPKPIHLPTLHTTLQRALSGRHSCLPRSGHWPRSLSLWHDDSTFPLSWHAYCSRHLRELTPGLHPNPEGEAMVRHEAW